MTNIKAVDVSEIEKLARYGWSDVGPIPHFRGSYIHVDDLHALFERSPSVSAPTIPEGYALVPIEPTEEMVKAVMQEVKYHYDLGISVRGDIPCRELCKAMLSANQWSDKDE